MWELDYSGAQVLFHYTCPLWIDLLTSAFLLNISAFSVETGNVRRPPEAAIGQNH